MDTDKKKLITYAWIAAAVVLVILLAWYFGKGGGVRTGLPGGQAGQGAAAVPGAGALQQSATAKPVTENIAVPDTSSNVSADVAKPTIVTPAAPGVTSKFRSFPISVSGNNFSPKEVIVNIGDTVNLKITAADKDYDFYQPDNGLSMPLPKGVPKTVEFQATGAFKYTFYCKSCGGPDKGPVGYVTVVPK